MRVVWAGSAACAAICRLGWNRAMSEPGYDDALRVLCDDAGVDLHRVLTAACEPLPTWDPVVYLADFAFQVLFPLAAGVAGQDVAGTMAAGRSPRASR